ncbi:MAG TPA: hypothetical protein VNT42_10405, partial [Sphingomonas sp.]|nr:hypothetical protein [Sphingomonas sp.]
MLLIFVVLWTAVFRAVIFPAESRFAYLRAGMDELRLLAVMLILMIGGYLALLLVILAVGALVAILAAAAGSTGVAAVVGVIFGFAILCLATWVAVRFSPAGPLTIYRRKIVIGPAWRLTRGTFWRLFGAYVLVALVLMAIYLPVIFIQMGPVLGDLMHPADPQAAARIAEWQAARYSGGLSPGMIGVAFVSAILGGVALALQAGVTAVATTQLIDQR